MINLVFDYFRHGQVILSRFMFVLLFLNLIMQDIAWIMAHVTAGRSWGSFNSLFPHRFSFHLQHDRADQQCRAGRADECAGVHSEAAPSRLTNITWGRNIRLFGRANSIWNGTHLTPKSAPRSTWLPRNTKTLQLWSQKIAPANIVHQLCAPGERPLSD